MNIVNKILVPIDGSEASKKAAEKALEIAKQYNSKITFISVATALDLRYRGYYHNVGFEFDDLVKENLNAGNKMLEHFTSQLDLDGINYENMVVDGEPYEEILKEANKSDYDYIVMGRRGYSKITRFFVGSVTQRVISESPCPVIVVNE